MMKMFATFLFSLFLLNMNGASFIDDSTIAFVVIYFILIHLFCIVAYKQRSSLLRVVCGILYLPILLITLFLCSLSGVFMFFFVPALIFYIFTIVKARNETK